MASKSLCRSSFFGSALLQFTHLHGSIKYALKLNPSGLVAEKIILSALSLSLSSKKIYFFSSGNRHKLQNKFQFLFLALFVPFFFKILKKSIYNSVCHQSQNKSFLLIGHSVQIGILPNKPNSFFEGNIIKIIRGSLCQFTWIFLIFINFLVKFLWMINCSTTWFFF